MPWSDAMDLAYAAGHAAMRTAIEIPLADADGLTLASPLLTLTDLPAFPTSSVDGYAVRGAGPWRRMGQVLAGATGPTLQPGECVEIATGAMVPAGTEHIVRIEHSTMDEYGRVTSTSRLAADWRPTGDEAAKGDELVPAGSPVTPAVIGVAAACGHDTLTVLPRPRTAVVVFGDELLTQGPPALGRVRDSLGPQVPGWLRRYGAATAAGFGPRGPVEDTLDAHLTAIRTALTVADVVCTTGGTMRGPVDHLHPALAELGGRYLVNSVAVRPGYPMVLAELPGADRPTFVVGLPGNPQSALVAMVTLLAPLLAGLAGRTPPPLGQVRLAADVPGRGGFTHLVPVRVEPDGLAYPLEHAGSAMLRGVARADGFAVITPGGPSSGGDVVPLVALPLIAGERP